MTLTSKEKASEGGLIGPIESDELILFKSMINQADKLLNWQLILLYKYKKMSSPTESKLFSDYL